MSEIRYAQVASTDLAVEKMGDGTTAVLDRRSMSVHSLNASASVVWEACGRGATLTQVRRALELQCGRPVEGEIAVGALAQLEQVKLIASDSALPAVINSGRRSAMLRLAAAAGIAVPVVLTLGASEQRAFAFVAASGNR